MQSGLEEKRWSEVKASLTENHSENSVSGQRGPITLGPYFSYIVRNSPRRLLHMLSYYKFAAKMIGPDKIVLDIGCSEGLGTVILGEFAKHCVGIDFDHNAIEVANSNHASDRLKFVSGDFLKESFGRFDAVACFDVIEHIYPENEEEFLTRITAHLQPQGMAIVGTPNITSDQYASAVTRAGHVNLYSANRLRESMSRKFQNVMIFSANDEVVHTGFSPMAHYLIALGVGLKV